ncbi:hypothetical protein NQD34_014816 [Periophthalmus magnuspinnatus]|nr:hypothetical protein NQD34_014816 [Periophthalmus magnuspinnatus]
MLAELYLTFCTDNRITPKYHVSDILEKTPSTEEYVLKLAGNNRVKPVERLDDQDALVLSKCLLNVKALDLSYNCITDEGIKHLAELLQEENSSLHSLDLTFNDFEDQGAEILSQSLQSNRTLLSLTLSGNKVKNTGGMSLASLLQLNNTLRVLRMANCDLKTESVIAFAIALTTNQTLRCLDISRCHTFGSEEEWHWTVHFAHMLAVNQSLLELHLGTMGIMTCGIERLSKGLLFNYTLKYLDLHSNRVTRDDVQPLVDVLMKENSTLEVLDLSSNQIQDEGAVLLSQALASPNCSLRELSLCSNSIRTEGLLSLAKTVGQNSTLTHLYIWGNHFEELVCLAFKNLIDSGRLDPGHIDVRAYEVDGHVYLSHVSQTLRRQFYEPKNNSSTTTFTRQEESTNRTSPKGIRFFV